MRHSSLGPLAVVILLGGCGTTTAPPSPPQVLAAGVGPYGIAVDSTAVYVSSLGPGSLLAIPNGELFVTLNVEGAGKGLAVDERRLYWGDGGSLLACDKANCAASVVRLSYSSNQVWDIALDADNVYWTTMPRGPGGPPQIMKVDKNSGTPLDAGLPIDGSAPLDGGASGDGGAAGPVQIATAQYPYNIAVDATYVYWVDATAPNAGVLKAPIAGGPAVQLAISDPVEPGGLALDDDNVYYGNGGGDIFKVSKNGGPSHVLVTGLGQAPGDLATDRTNLYIGADTKLLSVPLAGGVVRSLATGLRGSSSIALDDTSVYIAGGDDVLKVAK